MICIDKNLTRREKSRAYAEFARVVAETYKWFFTTPLNIVDCLKLARLNENNAVSAERSRELLRQETPPADPPPELCDETIGKYYFEAARNYDAAGTYAVLYGDLCRAFKRFHKAARCGVRCGQLLATGGPEVLAAVKEYREKAAMLRHEIARRSVRRRRLTLGLRGRMR